MRILGRAELEPLLSPRDVIEALAAAFRHYARGSVTVPPRTALPVGDEGLLLVMPAGAPEAGAPGGGSLGTKLVTFYPGNRSRGQPTHLATYVLMEAGTGRPLALLEATFLTGLRTGATSALAARYLARPDSHAIACFGTSVQAGHQLRCLAAVLPLERASVLGRDDARADRFARHMRETLGIPVDVARDPDAAVAGADVVTCATTSPVPLFHGDRLRPGSHVDAVGAFRPAERELDTATLRRARVVVESYAGVLPEAGDLVIPLAEGTIGRDHVKAELAELVAGTRPGRTSPEEITLFKSVGFALEDLAAARLAYERAVACGVGVEVTL